MNAEIARALETDRVVDITTIGRKTGEAHRLEIWFSNVEGSIYITGMPGKRSWYANMLANPEITFHLKQSTRADLPATAVAITDPDEKSRTLAQIVENFGSTTPLEDWVAGSPLVRVDLGDS